MRVPEDPAAKHVLVFQQLRLCVQPAAGVVKVDLIVRIQAGVLTGTQGFHGIGVPIRILEARRRLACRTA